MHRWSYDAKINKTFSLCLKRTRQQSAKNADEFAKRLHQVCWLAHKRFWYFLSSPIHENNSGKYLTAEVSNGTTQKTISFCSIQPAVPHPLTFVDPTQPIIIFGFLFLFFRDSNDFSRFPLSRLFTNPVRCFYVYQLYNRAREEKNVDDLL